MGNPKQQQMGVSAARQRSKSTVRKEGEPAGAGCPDLLGVGSGELLCGVSELGLEGFLQRLLRLLVLEADGSCLRCCSCRPPRLWTPTTWSLSSLCGPRRCGRREISNIEEKYLAERGTLEGRKELQKR